MHKLRNRYNAPIGKKRLHNLVTMRITCRQRWCSSGTSPFRLKNEQDSQNLPSIVAVHACEYNANSRRVCVAPLLNFHIARYAPR